MRRSTVMTVAILLAFGPAAAHAQVINGESTYEDNYVHTPPDEPAHETHDPKGKTSQPDAARTDPSKDADPPPY